MVIRSIVVERGGRVDKNEDEDLRMVACLSFSAVKLKNLL